LVSIDRKAVKTSQILKLNQATWLHRGGLNFGSVEACKPDNDPCIPKLPAVYLHAPYQHYAYH
jgi:hypothetical protein